MAERWRFGIIPISPRDSTIEQKGVVLVGKKGHTINKIGWSIHFEQRRGYTQELPYEQTGVVCREDSLSARIYPVLGCGRTKNGLACCPPTVRVGRRRQNANWMRLACVSWRAPPRRLEYPILCFDQTTAGVYPTLSISLLKVLI